MVRMLKSEVTRWFSGGFVVGAALLGLSSGASAQAAIASLVALVS